MLVDIKMYTNEKNPKVKCVRCYDINGNVIVITSDDIKYFNSDSNFYSIRMNNAKCMELVLPSFYHKSMNLSMIPTIGAYDFTLNDKHVDPNTIDFDSQFDVVFLDNSYGSISKYKDSIFSINILPTNNDLNFNMKTIDKHHNHVTCSISIDSGEFINYPFTEMANCQDNPIIPVPEPTYESIYDKLDHIEEKLDYIISKIGG